MKAQRKTVAKKKSPLQKLVTRTSRSKGRGVFAALAIRKGEVIEVAPYVRLSAGDHHLIRKTDLIRYIYDVGRGAVAVGLGFASLYNHSDDSNATFDVQTANKTLKYKATRDIKAGEEILIDYGYHPARPETWDEDYKKYVKSSRRRRA